MEVFARLSRSAWLSSAQRLSRLPLHTSKPFSAGTSVQTSLVGTEWLQNKINEKVEARKSGSDTNLRIVCCAGTNAERPHPRGYIPFASDLGVHPKLKSSGDKPSTTNNIIPARLVANLRLMLKIDNSSHVVLYDDNNSLSAARTWFVLKHYGHPASSIQVLDGGLDRWITEGRDVVSAPEPVDTSSVKDAEMVLPEVSDIVSIDRMKALVIKPDDHQIVDARSRNEYTGVEKHANKRGGHVPGAIHLDWRTVLDSNGMFRAKEELVQIFETHGVNLNKPAITYCQVGMRAAHLAFALQLAGCKDVSLYEGSMNEWLNRDETAIST
eukprot:GILK01004798.1.p1 GENE.GILK01004798.1~~GILK01004798.1.p1  ORF type:complete len:326 (-),score=43.52 GILK01004798.1:307-1284(-)